MTSPLTPSLSPAFAEAASRRQAPGEREIYRGINLNPLPLGDCVAIQGKPKNQE